MVSDLGIARFLTAGTHATTGRAGTWFSMDPNVRNGAPARPEDDMYAFGVTIATYSIVGYMVRCILTPCALIVCRNDAGTAKWVRQCAESSDESRPLRSAIRLSSLPSSHTPRYATAISTMSSKYAALKTRVAFVVL
jgi:hypothetical protein